MTGLNGSTTDGMGRRVYGLGSAWLRISRILRRE